MEEALWKSADKLRGSVEPAEYKHVVLSLFFLKFASDKFVECRTKIIASYGEKYTEMKPFYAQEEYMSLLKYIYRMAACQNQQFRCFLL